MALTALSGIFTIDGVGQTPTISNGDITIPSGSIVSYVPVSNTSPAASEFVFGMCETMHQAVTDGGLTNCTSSVATSLVGGNTLKKVYTFTLNLDFASADLNNLDVKSG
jgi:hypothetical protein